MKTIKTSFDEMLASISPAIQQEVSLKFAISKPLLNHIKKHCDASNEALR